MVLFGTEGTNNQLNDDLPESYKHVTVLKPLDVADIDICNVLSTLKPSKGRIAGDFLDGLIVSCEMMDRKLGSKKYDKRCVEFVKNYAELCKNITLTNKG